MTEKTPDTLDRLWDDIPTGHAPITDILAAGQAAKRRKRRTVLAGVAAATALVIGGGFVTAQNLTGTDAPREDTFVADAAGEDLTVKVQIGVSAEARAVRPRADENAAIWDHDALRLIYVSGFGYSITCPPVGTVNRGDGGDLTLELSKSPTSDHCGYDARQVTATISGLTAPPTELRVTEYDQTRAVPVRENPDEPSSAPFSVYTHCGVESVRIDGRWWHASPPLYNQERSGPPAGWGDPYQEGTLTMESADRAVFEALGQRVVFVPAPDDEPIRVCR